MFPRTAIAVSVMLKVLRRARINRYEGAIMRKLTTAAVTLALALASGATFADDSSMSQWTGESYKAVGIGESKRLNASPDNGMSRWNGDSYVAFEQARTLPAAVTISIAEANK